jgi:hypothetical protein
MTIEPTALRDHIDPDGRGGRRHIDDVALAVRTLAPHLDAAAIPEFVRGIVDAGAQQGLWSAARTTTVTRGRTTLPRTITLPRTAAPADRMRPANVPLRDELAPWATRLPLSQPQRDVLLAVNDWLRRTNGGDTPTVEAAERAYEILRDEKAFDSHPPRGGAALWAPDRITFELLRCHRTATPLTWEPTSSNVNQSGRVLCVENHATFRTLLRIMRAQRRPLWVAVAWVQGRNTAPLESLNSLPFTATRLDYLGDLDPAGLAIAAAACATAREAGVPAGPAEELWTLLVQQPHRPGPSTDTSSAQSLVSWLPVATRKPAYTLITTGRAIPQEALRFDLLTAALEDLKTRRQQPPR